MVDVIFMPNKQKTAGLILLASMLLLSAIALTTAQTQNQAIVTILPSGGGNIDPAPGTYTYNDGTTITLSATANSTGSFANWIIFAGDSSSSSTDNPLSLKVSGGVTYTVQAVIVPVLTLPNATARNLTGAAIITILAASGGTTSPKPGTYALANATSFNLTAVPDSDWKFSHWVISGDTRVSHGGTPVNLEPTDNPYNVNHGYGYSYTYQAVFTQSSSTSPSPSSISSASPSSSSSSLPSASTSSSPSPSPTIPELSIVLVIATLVAVLPVAILTKRKQKNQT
jgi:hypothetical protein